MIGRDAYDQLLRDLEAERYAPPPSRPPAAEVDEQLLHNAKLAQVGADPGAARRAQLLADTIAYEHGKTQRRLRAIS